MTVMCEMVDCAVCVVMLCGDWMLAEEGSEAGCE